MPQTPSCRDFFTGGRFLLVVALVAVTALPAAGHSTPGPDRPATLTDAPDRRP
ncbi:hypothetical protein [Kineosporia succinea]|uniref:Uncharacterized protein n=1 Tax=Kineosporia succinea TaxID=84632 RepID=A0ABT9NXB7_9ACTN|nr:hypothetical protein [Kineosporia succinea]MDP9825064.1 hypothetical protein [Kineosporia succinea]